MSEHQLDDQAEADDEIIGVVFKRSLIVIALIGAIVAGVFLLGGEEDEPEVVLEKDVGEIESLETDVDVLPEVRFTNVTEAAGIDFVHTSGAAGAKLLPETMGGGGAFFDHDLDGDQDLFLVNGRAWPEDGGEAPGHRLYENDGTGQFTDVSAAVGLEGGGYGMGCAVGDVNGDGDLDLFVTGVGGNQLLVKEGGRFVDRTETSALGGAPDAWSTSAGFFDMDGDGDLDLFVCHYVKWSRAIDDELAYTLNGEDRAYGPPMNYAGSFSSLYRNDGSGVFEDVSEAAGLHITNPATGAPMGKALGVSFLDVEGDGDTDVFVANDTVQNFLFVNDGTGIFEEAGANTGFAFDRNGNSTGAMGIDVGDYRGDGSYAICIGNFAKEMSSLYVKDPRRLRFTDDAIGEGIGSPSRSRLSFGLFFFDYDLDGRLDLLQINGHLEESINEVQPSQTYLQRPQLFWNQGPDARRCYTEVPPVTAGDLDTELAGRGSAFADIDGDGDLDVLVCQVGRAPLLLRNDQALDHRWLRVRLEQTGPNRHALGAAVEVTVGGEVLRRSVTATRSYLSQSELPATFGLGQADEVEAIAVVWPDGTRQDVPVPAELGQEITVRR